jgi:hypothetical protein
LLMSTKVKFFYSRIFYLSNLNGMLVQMESNLATDLQGEQSGIKRAIRNRSS